MDLLRTGRFRAGPFLEAGTHCPPHGLGGLRLARAPPVADRSPRSASTPPHAGGTRAGRPNAAAHPARAVRTPTRSCSRSSRPPVLSKYRVERKEDLPINFGGIMLQASGEFTNTIQDAANASLGTIFDRQDSPHPKLHLCLALLAIRIASMALAGDRPTPPQPIRAVRRSLSAEAGSDDERGPGPAKTSKSRQTQ